MPKMWPITTFTSFCICIVTSALLLAWNLADPTWYRFENLTGTHQGSSYYDEAADIHYVNQLLVCHSKYVLAWILTGGALHCLLMAICLVFFFRMRNDPFLKSHAEFRLVRLLVASIASLLAASLLLAVILINWPIIQQIAISFIDIAVSVIASSIIFVPMLKA